MALPAPLRPSDLYDRVSEWEALATFATDSRPGATLGIVSGRRRQGKSFLLDALSESLGGFVFTATEATEAESLRRLGRELSTYGAVPGPLALPDWATGVDALLALGGARAIPVVLDEFPYLARSAPSLPSVIQRALGARRPARKESRCRLLLCGSAISFMGRLLAGTAPLRGRAGLELTIQPFDYRQAAQFWGIGQPRLALLVHAVVGGTPAYRREYTSEDPPATLDGFDDWVARTALNRASPLFHEGRYLLATEPDLRDTSLYHSVLSAVATGDRTRGAIASFIGRSASDISHHLSVLEGAGLLRRADDVFRRSRPTYSIAEPLLAFHSAIVRPSFGPLARPERAARVWQASKVRFSAQIVGPHFEQVCRDWCLLFAGEETFGSPVSRVGAGVVHDPRARIGLEVDAAVYGGSRRLLAIGEANWGQTLGTAEIQRLEQIRELLRARGDATTGTRLACFSGVGFTADLRRLAARRGDVILVDLDRLYHGE